MQFPPSALDQKQSFSTILPERLVSGVKQPLNGSTMRGCLRPAADADRTIQSQILSRFQR